MTPAMDGSRASPHSSTQTAWSHAMKLARRERSQAAMKTAEEDGADPAEIERLRMFLRRCLFIIYGCKRQGLPHDCTHWDETSKLTKRIVAAESEELDARTSDEYTTALERYRERVAKPAAALGIPEHYARMHVVDYPYSSVKCLAPYLATVLTPFCCTDLDGMAQSFWHDKRCMSALGIGPGDEAYSRLHRRASRLFTYLDGVCTPSDEVDQIGASHAADIPPSVMYKLSKRSEDYELRWARDKQFWDGWFRSYRVCRKTVRAIFGRSSDTSGRFDEHASKDLAADSVIARGCIICLTCQRGILALGGPTAKTCEEYTYLPPPYTELA